MERQHPSEFIQLSMLQHGSSQEELFSLSIDNIRRALFGFRSDDGDGNADTNVRDNPVEIDESLLIDTSQVWIGKMIGEGRHSIVYEGL